MAIKAVSFRSQLTGDIHDFLSDEDMACLVTEEALVELVVSLARYREEGVALFPEVFVCDDLKRMLSVLPGCQSVAIGSGVRDKATINMAVKHCAPLARRGWAIYIHRRPGAFDYGVFHSIATPLSLAPTDVLIDVKESTLPVLRAVQLAENAVEIRGSGGHCLHFYLSDARTDGPAPSKAVDDLAEAIVADVPAEHRPLALRYFHRTLVQGLREGHGSLIAVMPKRKRAVPKFLRKGALLSEPIDIFGQILKLEGEKGETVISDLLSTTELVCGMMASDGIVLFRSDARLVGFRILISRPTKQETSGATRRLAYNTMCEHIDAELTAAFFRSQDGHMECKRANE
jgi:hypothetical protein